MWIHMTIFPNELFSVWNSKYWISQSTRCTRCNELFVSLNSSLSRSQSESFQLIIIQCIIVNLIVFNRIIDSLIVAFNTTIRTPSHINRNMRITNLCMFCCHHDNAIGSSCSIECGRRRIFQYGYRCHIGRVKVVPTAIVRRTIYDNQRTLSCANTTKATYTDRRGCSRFSAVVYNLNTSSLTFQTTHYVIDLLMFNLFRVNNGSRACKSRTLLFTEGSYNHLVQRRVVVNHRNLHCRFGRTSEGFHTDIRYF